MSLPQTIGAYTDCSELFERAAADERGARACLGTYEACIQMRTRMHYFRLLDRRANSETYPKGDPMHGASTYDGYVVQLQKDQDEEWWLYVQPRSSKILAIEGLSEPHLQPESTDD